MSFSSPQVFGPYLTLVVFLIAAFAAVGREFWMARGLDKAYPLSRVFLAVPLAVFGAEHLTSAQAIMNSSQLGLPGKLFWTYFVGVALIAAALSFIFQVWIRVSAALLGIMFFCFVAMMDFPAAIAAPQIGSHGPFSPGSRHSAQARYSWPSPAACGNEPPAENRTAIARAPFDRFCLNVLRR